MAIKRTFVFGGFTLEAESRLLSNDGREVRLPKRPFDVLLYLIERRDGVVSRQELLERFWEGHDVYDDALRKTIGVIRKSLNDLEKPPRFIETRYGNGFRFIGDVQEEESVKIPAVENRTAAPMSGTEVSGKRYVFLTILTACAIAVLAMGFLAFRPGSGSPSDLALEPGDKRSIAVLPLKNMTGDPENDFLSDGITESIITELSRIRELKVISRSSTFALKDKDVTAPEIAEKLRIGSFLEGSLQRKGDSLHVNVRLVSAVDGRVLWTSTEIQRPLTTAFELQDVISCNVANELGSELCSLIPQNPRRYTKNGDAYQAYLRGRFYWNKRTGDGIKRSVEYYERSIALDGGFSPAYAGLAESYVQGIWHVPFLAKDVLPKARSAALKSVELDPNLAEARTALANVYQLEWNWEAAEREIAHAVELNPRYARGHHVQAFCFLVLGRKAEAVASIERAMELDPLNLVVNTDLAMIYFVANRDQDAFQQWEKTLELDPNFVLAREHRAVAYEVTGQAKEAIEEKARVMELYGETAEKIASFRHTAADRGLSEIYRKELRTAVAKKTHGEYVSPVSLALLYVALGQDEEVFQHLETAFAERSPEIVLVLTSRQFDPVRSDARFVSFLERTAGRRD